MPERHNRELRFNREKMKEQLGKRTRESYDRRESSGRFKGIFKDNLPEHAQFWKVSESDHVVDLIPFMAGPILGQSKIQEGIKEGDWAYVLEVSVHRRVGPMERDVVCLTRFFGKKCPVCEVRNLILRKPKQDITAFEQDILDKYENKRRTVYNIWCKDNTKEIQKGVQIWEVAHFLFERHVTEAAQLPLGGGWVDYTSPDGGKSIFFKRKGTGATNTEYLKHQFIPREEPIPDEILAQAHTLDGLIHIYTYEEIFELLFQFPFTGQAVTLEMIYGQKPQVAEHHQPAPAANPTPAPTPEYDAPLSQMDEPPATAPEPEAPPTTDAAAKPDVEGECPFGHAFGADLDKFTDCQKCGRPKWDACADRTDALLLEKTRRERQKAKDAAAPTSTQKPGLRKV